MPTIAYPKLGITKRLYLHKHKVIIGIVFAIYKDKVNVMFFTTKMEVVYMFDKMVSYTVAGIVFFPVALVVALLTTSAVVIAGSSVQTLATLFVR